MKRIYVMSYPTVLNGTRKIKLKEFKRKGILYYLYITIMRFIYDTVEVVEE